MLSDHDLKTISIFKSKDEYFRLKNDIDRKQKIITYFNLGWMIILGVVNLIAAIVNTIMATSPLPCEISFKLNSFYVKFPDASLDQN